MTAWPFVVGAYGVTIVLTIWVTLWSFISMRRAEAAADALKRQ